MKHTKTCLRTALAVSALAIVPQAVNAQAYLATDNLGYTGTVSCYATLADAIARSNASCSAAIPQRDLSLYFVDNNPVFAGTPTYPASAAIMLTNWYSNGGSGNPNNTNVGFFQMYDNDASTVTSSSMGWSDPSKTVFDIAISGGPTITGCTAMPPQDCGRLWNGGTAARSGTYSSWSINASISGLAPAVWDPVTGVFVSTSEPGSVSGTITGVFQDATTLQYHAIDATINMTSWAVTNGFATSSTFGAPMATPEPVTMTLIGTGLAGVAAARRRRKTQGA